MDKNSDDRAAFDGNCAHCGHHFMDHWEYLGDEKGCRRDGCGCKSFVYSGGEASRPAHFSSVSQIGIGNQARTAKKQCQGAPEALKKALQDHLRSIIEKPFGPKMLMELRKTASYCRLLLITAGDPSVKVQGRRSLGLGGLGEDYLEEGQELDAEFEGPAIVPQAETFGASAIRELVAATKERNEPGIVELTKALSIAKASELHEVARNLENQLLQKTRSMEMTGWDFKKEVEIRPDPVDAALEGLGKPEGGAA